MSQAPYKPAAWTKDVLDQLRAQPGLWLAISTHVSTGAAQVAAWRWRQRFHRLADGGEFRARPYRPPGTEGHPRPHLCLLSFRPSSTPKDQEVNPNE
jgi:hypothetical protein